METKKQITVLIADDDVDYLAQVKMNLETAGFNVLSAEGQTEAEEILKTTKPDIVVSDLMMERYDGGFGLSNTVKNIDKNIPVILVTSVASALGLRFSTATEEEKAWIKADAFLNKPIRFEQLLKEINKLLPS